MGEKIERLAHLNLRLEDYGRKRNLRFVVVNGGQCDDDDDDEDDDEEPKKKQ